MKQLSILLIALMMLCLHAQPAVHSAAPVAERWEIVTDIYIGVQTERLTAEERAAYGAALPRHQGLRIKRVIPGSPAEKAGLQAGDLILKNNGARIATMEDLLLSVRNTRAGEYIHVNILRGGQKIPVAIKVEALPQPVVVAYATLRRHDISGMACIAANQKRIADLLSADTPNLPAIHEEFRQINNLFPSLARPGHIRLYYETSFGYITVTAYVDCITVTVQHTQSVTTYHLRQPGDTLPTSVKQALK